MRTIYVIVGSSVAPWKITDEIAVLSRHSINEAVRYDRESGNVPDSNVHLRCQSGMLELRSLLQEGMPDPLNPDDTLIMRRGMAKLALYRLYDDLILRHYHPSSEEQVFWLDPPVPLSETGPDDTYYSALPEDGETVEGFRLFREPPPNF